MRFFLVNLLLVLPFCIASVGQQPQLQGYQSVDCSGTATPLLIALDNNNCSQTSISLVGLSISYLPAGRSGKYMTLHNSSPT